MKYIIVALILIFIVLLYPIKVGIFDITVPSSHTTTCSTKVYEQCPTATIITYQAGISFSLSDIIYAKTNNVDIIVRPCTGFGNLSDADIDSAWSDAAHASQRVAIVWAYGDNNNHVEYLSDGTIPDLICAVGGGSSGFLVTNYGDGLDFFVNGESTSSYSSGVIGGMIAQLMVDNPTWNFQDARQALRQTASNYEKGWVTDGGWGYVDADEAGEVTNLEMMPPYRVDYTAYTDSISFTWQDSKQSDVLESTIVLFDYEPTVGATPLDGSIIYTGSAEEYTYSHSLNGHYWFGFYTKGSYSQLESFVIEEIVLHPNYTTCTIFIGCDGGLSIEVDNQSSDCSITIGE